MLDTFMLVMFILFMVFLFGGYHKTKSAQREKENEMAEKVKENSLK